jgi:hypothetical protein
MQHMARTVKQQDDFAKISASKRLFFTEKVI